MKLTQRQIELLDFCEDAKLVDEIAARFQIHTRSVYPYLRRLIKGGLIKAESGYKNDKRQSVKRFIAIKSAIDANVGHDSNDPDLSNINMDFVRAAHNPFRLGAHHG
jgi:hypothetical protein